jgi:hypothetical protein
MLKACRTRGYSKAWATLHTAAADVDAAAEIVVACWQQCSKGLAAGGDDCGAFLVRLVLLLLHGLLVGEQTVHAVIVNPTVWAVAMSTAVVPGCMY